MSLVNGPPSLSLMVMLDTAYVWFTIESRSWFWEYLELLYWSGHLSCWMEAHIFGWYCGCSWAILVVSRNRQKVCDPNARAFRCYNLEALDIEIPCPRVSSIRCRRERCLIYPWLGWGRIGSAVGLDTLEIGVFRWIVVNPEDWAWGDARRFDRPGSGS